MWENYIYSIMKNIKFEIWRQKLSDDMKNSVLEMKITLLTLKMCDIVDVSYFSKTKMKSRIIIYCVQNKK